MRTIVCEICRKTVTATSGRQKYCPECRVKAAKVRDRIWYEEKKRRKRTEKAEWAGLQAYDTAENVAICLSCPLSRCHPGSSICKLTDRGCGRDSKAGQ